MKIEVSGYYWQAGTIHDFNDTFVTTTDDAAGVNDLRALLEADGVHISAMRNVDNDERYFTEGEAVAMGHTCNDTPSKDIFVYVSDGIFLHFNRIMK